MKLPFKFPSIKLPKFGKKKAVDDEDDEDLDFDPSDFEDDASVEASAEISPDADAQAPAEEADVVPEGEPEAEAAAADETVPAAADADAGDVADVTADLEDIDFGDDDEDDDEDEDEEGDAKPKRKMLLIGGGAAAAVLLTGGLSWFFLAGDGGEDKAANKNPDVPLVSIKIAPKRKMEVGGGLNAIAGGGLNAIVSGEPRPGVGLVVPVVPASAFASIKPPQVVDAPLQEQGESLFSETTPQGLLPKISEDGRMAWKVYAKPFEESTPGGRISIVIRGLGQSESATEAAIRLLPGNVTLAFDPYAPRLPEWVAMAREAGHEVMIMLPLEPITFPLDDPGPQALMTSNAPEENRLRLEYVLSRMNAYIGVMTVMGSKFNASEEHMRTFLEEIKDRGLMFLEGDVDKQSLAPKIAAELSLPRAFADIVLDAIPTSGAIDNQLAELEGLMLEQKVAVAIAEAYPSSIERLAVWTAGLKSKNLVLAPLSALADKQLVE